jgi:hypothetical protein
MVQFYVLAILFNVIGGALLAGDYFGERFPLLKQAKEGLRERSGIRLVLMIITLVIAIFKLLSVSAGDVPVVGDLLPALSLIIITFINALDYYLGRSEVASEGQERLERVFIANESIFGVGAVVIGVLHFLFPGVLFL